MELHPVSPATTLLHKFARRSIPVRLAALAVAAVFTASQVPAQPLMDRDTTSQTQVTNAQATTTTAQATTASQGNHGAPAAQTATDLSAPVPSIQEATLPDAPAATSESASLNVPVDLKGMMDDSAQAAQNLQPTTTEQKQKIHPGWLALSVVGIGAALIGGVGLTGTKNKGLAAGFLASGAALTAGGFYFTFRK